LDRAEPDHEPAEREFDVRRDPLRRGAERLGEAQEIAIKTHSGLDIAGVEIYQAVDEHAANISGALSSAQVKGRFRFRPAMASADKPPVPTIPSGDKISHPPNPDGPGFPRDLIMPPTFRRRSLRWLLICGAAATAAVVGLVVVPSNSSGQKGLSSAVGAAPSR